MLTDLFLEKMALDEHHKTALEMRSNAESFGMGLQLVNILKDITDDRERGWSFVPRLICNECGIDLAQLVDPSCRERAHRVMLPLFELARARLDRALRYVLTIPEDQTSIRIFCLLPLWMAVKTLVHAVGNDSMFVAREPVKISRQDVEQIAARCIKHCGDNDFLQNDYDAMWADFRIPSAQHHSASAAA
jgi:farnesyl-diphosphate farnesyltransferase